LGSELSLPLTYQESASEACAPNWSAYSCKPPEGYADYHGKMTTYAGVIAGPAAVLKPELKLRSYSAPEPEEDTVFNYTETASDRVGIGALTDLLKNERVVFIGLGGTGAYALDLVAKTPVATGTTCTRPTSRWRTSMR
jgi:hypothetical protein